MFVGIVELCRYIVTDSPPAQVTFTFLELVAYIYIQNVEYFRIQLIQERMLVYTNLSFDICYIILAKVGLFCDKL